MTSIVVAYLYDQEIDKHTSKTNTIKDEINKIIGIKSLCGIISEYLYFSMPFHRELYISTYPIQIGYEVIAHRRKIYAVNENKSKNRKNSWFITGGHIGNIQRCTSIIVYWRFINMLFSVKISQKGQLDDPSQSSSDDPTFWPSETRNIPQIIDDYLDFFDDSHNIPDIYDY